MSVKKIALFLLLLTFLSGTFTLGRLNVGIGFDIRYVLFFVFTLVVLMVLKKKDGINEEIRMKNLTLFFSIMLLYFFMSTLSLLYTVNQTLALEKYISLLFLMLLIIGCLYIVNNMKTEEFFGYVSTFFIVIGIIYVLPILYSVLTGADRGDVLLSGPNVTTRILFFAVCAALYRHALSRKTNYIILSLLFFTGIVVVGSRGGLVAAVATLTLMFIIKKVLEHWKIKRPRITYRNVFLFPFVITIIALLYSPVKRVFMDRFIGVTFGGNEVYTSGRDIIYKDAIRMIEEKPFFGHGVEAYTLTTGHVYPHNLLLEMMVEIGIFGALIFLAFMIYSVVVMFKLKNTSLFLLSGLPLYMIIVQMFSGEFYDFRYYFLWIIPLLYYSTVSSELKLEKLVKPTKTRIKRKIVWAKLNEKMNGRVVKKNYTAQ